MDQVLNSTGTAYVDAVCPRCGIQRPWHCECDETFDVNKGRAEIVVGGMGTVYANKEGGLPEYDVLLTVRDAGDGGKTVEWKLQMTPDDAIRFADKVRGMAEKMKMDLAA